MTLVVRNTFLHFSQSEDGSHHRSTSAPATCRQAPLAAPAKAEDEPAAASTTCDTPDASTLASDMEDVMSQSSNEHEDLSPPMSDCDSSDDEDEGRVTITSVSSTASTLVPQNTLSQKAAQEQLEQMSQAVMDIWSKLRMVETSLEAKQEQIHSSEKPAEDTAPTAGHRLDTSAASFCPSCDAKDTRSFLVASKQALASIQGVSSVDVNMGPAGTLATVSIRTGSTSSKEPMVKPIVAAAKSMLLDLAANSACTYVLGYEAEPFQDHADGRSFVATLASMADESSACWDLYQRGVCSRRKTCKWQHPGRNELQPVRVVVL